MKAICLVWGPFGHRADELAQAVGAERVNVTLLYGPRYFAPLRYLFLFFRTLALLFSRTPDVVYAQNPPVFCPLTSLLYCKATGRRLVVDHHSLWSVKTLGGPVGAVLAFLERFVSNAAYANSAPHDVWADRLRGMGARRVVVVHDHVDPNPYKRDAQVRGRYSPRLPLAIASHGGHPLERLESEVSAAAASGAFTLLVTGPPAKLAPRIAALSLPQNVKYLGMLPMEEYLRLKASCDFALNITDEPFTLSHVIFEYLASSLPVVSSRQEVVEAVFGDSLLYADSSDPREVAVKADMLARDSKVLREMQKRARERFALLERERLSEVARLKEGAFNESSLSGGHQPPG